VTAPLVSVVTSVYNGGLNLRPSLESVLNQQGVDFELLAVNDGSTDDSPALLEELARRDPRVQVLQQPNQGLTRALMRGCAEARGEFIARHDADDLSLPGRLERQARRLQSDPSLSMVSCWAKALGPENELLWELCRTTEPAAATERLLHHYEGPPHHGSVMFRKSCYERVGGYRAEFYFAQDSDLWLRLGEVGRLAYEQAFLYTFRIGESSISSTWRTVQHELGELAHACQAARRLGKSETEWLQRAAALRPGLVPRAKPDPAAGAYFIGRCLLARNNPQARRYLWEVVRQQPWKLGAWMGLLSSYSRSMLPLAA
jgi:glycosyltransferase involved in cell wall biosynthesis